MNNGFHMYTLKENIQGRDWDRNIYIHVIMSAGLCRRFAFKNQEIGGLIREIFYRRIYQQLLLFYSLIYVHIHTYMHEKHLFSSTNTIQNVVYNTMTNILLPVIHIFRYPL